ncbi:hypothetical protein X977_5762 [Burkholderia pseudomallei MSHR7504]|nr:hypothetical protein X977_5762 [Burkholderia pseudomallei MSHR7504]
MQIEQPVGLVDERPDRACAIELDRVLRQIVEHGGRPHAIEILIDEARGVGPCRIETLVCGHVRERHSQHAAARPQAPLQQRVDDDRAAYFVAVRERVDHHARAGHAGIEAMHVVDARVSGAMCLEIRKIDLDRIVRKYGSRFGHGELFRESGNLPCASAPQAR